MMVNAQNMVSMTEANQDFSRVARMVDEKGAVMEFSQAEDEQMAEDEDILAISKRLMERNQQAYEVLSERND